jgi:hypothetical protein
MNATRPAVSLARERTVPVLGVRTLQASGSHTNELARGPLLGGGLADRQCGVLKTGPYLSATLPD